MQSAAPETEINEPPPIEHVAALGREARRRGNHAAITDPEQIAAIRRRVEAGVARQARRRAWRRRLLLVRRGGA